jgi:hypothetical protein
MRNQPGNGREKDLGFRDSVLAEKERRAQILGVRFWVLVKKRLSKDIQTALGQKHPTLSAPHTEPPEPKPYLNSELMSSTTALWVLIILEMAAKTFWAKPSIGTYSVSEAVEVSREACAIRER